MSARGHLLLAGAVVLVGGILLMSRFSADMSSKPAEGQPAPVAPTAAIEEVLAPEPVDAAAAKRTAAAYAVALYNDDIQRMMQLATRGHAAMLAEPSVSVASTRRRAGRDVRAAAVQTEDFRGDMALLQVLIERRAAKDNGTAAPQLQLVNVVVLREGDEWRVDEASF